MKLHTFGEEHKTFSLKLDGPITPEGTFTGYLSVYNVVDLGKDLVEPGAFTKTIKDNNSKVPMFINHDPNQTVGMLTLTDDEHGLKVAGEMYIDVNPLAAQWHATAQRFAEAGRAMGLSIGYNTVKSIKENGIRKLKELKLHEGSLTPLPMCQEALLTAVKSLRDSKSEFTDELAEAQIWGMHCMMMDALDSSLCNIRWTSDGSAAEKLQAASDSIDDFKTDYLGYLPNYFDLTGVKQTPKEKAGRRISAASRSQIEDAIAQLQALLAEEADDTAGTAAAVTPDAKAATPISEPDELHSMVETFAEKLKAALAA